MPAYYKDGYNTEGYIVEEKNAGGCAYVYFLCVPDDELLLVMPLSLQVPTGDRETDRHISSFVRCAHNLAILEFRSLVNWASQGVYDFAREAVWFENTWED